MFERYRCSLKNLTFTVRHNWLPSIYKRYGKMLFPILGLGSLAWFLIRVIPKPSRAAYPCMKVAAPMASSFVLWILGLAASLTAYKGMKSSFAKSAYFKASIFLVAGIAFTIFTFSQSGVSSFADTQNSINFIQAELDPNSPMGTPVGIFPGRVVWVHDPDATNEDCDPMELGNSYFEPKNNNQAVIDGMVSKVITNLTGESTDSNAWDAIFKFHNNTRGKGEVGYQAGEKIFIKINATSGWSGNIDDNDLSKIYENWWGGVSNYYGLSETTPSFILSVLRNLVNTAGVDQSNIYIGDPMKYIYKHSYDYLHAEFPDVHYLDHTGHTDIGRELAEKGTIPKIQYSDRGTVLVSEGNPVSEDKLYTIYEDMEYMLNLPSMKGHVRGGVTMFAKNHFGSHTRDGANHLHNGLMEPGETGLTTRSGFGLYRVQVDLMGHELLGKKNLFYLMDGLWGTDHELNPPHKWQTAPFNGDWTSSVLASFDPVAIESVGYDLVRTEFTLERYPTSDEDVVKVIQLEGVCDYLRQAADSANWPEGIQYDPENDGTVLTSLGIHEHWNDGINKEYSKNLGTGEGIELIKISGTPVQVLENPSSLSAIVSNNTDVEITWSDNSSDEDGFVIERRENVENSEYIVLDSVGADLTSYSDLSEKSATSYYYRVKAFNSEMESEYTEPYLVDSIVLVNVGNEEIVNEFKLNQNYPNPFNPTTAISFVIKNKSEVKLSIYDALGNLLNVLVNDNKSEGYHTVNWNGTNFNGEKVVSGIYIYRLTVTSGTESFVESKKMTLLK